MLIAPDQLHNRDDLFTFEERDPNASALDAHWHLFIAMLSVAVRSFGAPAKLFLCFLMEKTEHRAASKILRGLEAMLRRILLIEAAQDARPLEPLSPSKKRAPFQAKIIFREPLLCKPER